MNGISRNCSLNGFKEKTHQRERTDVLAVLRYKKTIQVHQHLIARFSFLTVYAFFWLEEIVEKVARKMLVILTPFNVTAFSIDIEESFAQKTQ